MTTFTRVLINPARRKGRTYITNPQALHAAVRSCFPPDLDQSSERILYRVDKRGHEFVLYIVAPEKPDAAHIVDEAGWNTRPQQTADYEHLLSRIESGQRWNFELLVNPTKSLNRGRTQRGKVVAHLSDHEQMKWLLSKAETMGVSFGSLAESSARIIEKQKLDFRKSTHKGARVHLVTARFAGTLEVQDPEKLREVLVKGIGRAKGYGCGLLTLAASTE